MMIYNNFLIFNVNFQYVYFLWRKKLTDEKYLSSVLFPLD